MTLEATVAEIAGAGVRRKSALHGGSIGHVYRLDLEDGRTLVAKAAGDDGTLDIEGDMLRYLRQNSALPVPDVIHSAHNLLVITYVPGDSNMTPQVQRHAAEILAELHAIRADQYGFETDTLIGGLHQPNPWTDTWLDFFADHRLRYMAAEATRAGRLPSPIEKRIDQFCERLEEFIVEPDHPSLLHGDMWTTNILAQNGRITGFIDPAIYYGHPEIELAFSTLFGTFGDPFFQRYHELRPIPPGFFETRRDIYNLYPLLVHVRLFGGGYVASVDRILQRLGF